MFNEKNIANYQKSKRLNSYTEIAAEDFIDEIFLALRLIYNAEICIDRQNKIKIIFSENCGFIIKVFEEQQ